VAVKGCTTGMAQIIEFAGNHPYLVGSLVGLTALVIVNEVRSGMSGANASPTPKAASILRKASFSRVVNLKGGLAAWERESLPLERQAKKSGKKGKGKRK
jgi:hypothetical protein